MEGVPRLSMLSVGLKTSPGGTNFTNLKKFIAECYQENPDTYSKEIYDLEMLRNSAMHPAKDVSGCATLKRYYCQLHSLANRFPGAFERNLIAFSWKGVYNNSAVQAADIRYEMAAVLYNIAALHTQLGAAVSRVDADGMKLACTHFQCAAWAFGELKDKYKGLNNNMDFMSPKLLIFLQNVAFAQAQECILEKSLIDNRKPAIVAKVTAQIVNYYNSAMAALLTTGDDSIAEIAESSLYKEWKKYVKFKISYMLCILYLYQGQQSEEQKKMGERVTLYQAAWDKLEEARKESKGMADQKQLAESLSFTADVVENKRKNAKNENEFIYHEAVPELGDIQAIQGANVVNGISFSVTDPEVAGEDIFARLVPMKAHEASSLYSEEKAQLLRKFGTQIEDRDSELATFMSSLNIDHLNVSEERNSKIPQGIVDRCASINAKPNAIPDLIASMSNLAEICCDVEANLKEIKDLLNEEELNEKVYQQKSGVHRPNVHITELSREYQKYLEAHQKAGESNDTLRRAMELHVNNLRVLAKPLTEIQSSVPKLVGDVNDKTFQDLKLLLNKVNEMKAQRAQFHADLRIAINNDDITSKIVAYGSDKDLKELFQQELAKHEKICTLIEKNLGAQANILSALKDAYAKCAPTLKTMADVKHKRENFFTALAASYDVYEDLLAKSAKGLEFYKKLQTNVAKLLSRVRAARDVQDEERHQRLSSVKEVKAAIDADLSKDRTSSKSNQPKLKDFLKSGKSASNLDTTYIPPVRPNPLGSETPSTSTCVVPPSSTYYQNPIQQQPDSIQPMAYMPTSQQFYDSSGYTNPMYQHNQMYDPTARVDPNYMSNMNQMANYQNTSYANQTPYSTYSATQLSQPNFPQMPSTVSAQNFQTDQSSYATPPANASSPYATQTYDSQMNTLNKPQSSMNSYQYSPSQGNYTQQTYDVSGSYQNPISMQQDTTAYAAPTQINSSMDQSLQSNAAWNAASLTKQMENINLQGNNTSSAYNPYQQQTSQPYDQQALQSYGQQQQVSAAGQQQSYGQQQQVSASDVNSSGFVQSSATSLVNSTLNGQSSYSSHPGYGLNAQTGEYQYASGYQVDPNSAPSALYTQYTRSISSDASKTTDSTHLSIAGQTYANQYSTPTNVQNVSQPVASAGSNYYTTPYGYQSVLPPNVAPAANYILSSAETNPQYMNTAQSMTYMHSNNGSETNTTLSGVYGESGVISPNDSSVDPYQTAQTQMNSDSSTVPYQAAQTQMNVPDPASVYQLSQNQPSGYQQTQQIPTQYQSVPSAESSQATTTESLSEIQSHAKHYVVPTVQQFEQVIQHHASQAEQQTQNEQSAVPTQMSQPQLNTTQPVVPIVPQQVPEVKPAQQAPTIVPKKIQKESSNIDLLSGIDFSPAAALPTPTLQPQIAPPSRPASVVTTKEPENSQNDVSVVEKDLTPSKSIDKLESLVSEPDTKFAATDRKSSCDNISICSDVSSIDQNFDWDSISLRGEKTSVTADALEKLQTKAKDPFDDAKTLKYFHKEVESYEKMIESLNIKMLNGNTPLVNKWKELQDLLVKDEAKRTTSVAKLFPEKNRTPDCIPYDHARVVLERNTDDYINAAYVKDLGSKCPVFIIAQTPLQNTVNDFWSMIWSQKSRTVVCLHTPNEILDTFWPQELDKEKHFDDFTVTLVKQFDLSHCIELNLKVTLSGADAILDLSLLQIKTWVKNSPTHILGIAQNILVAYKLRSLEFKSNAPLIMNCLTGSERAGLVALALCTITATETRRPVLINVVDVWYRICSQRKAALRDTGNLQLSMQIVLSHAHDVLNKRGIMTSYQMKNAQSANIIEKEEVKDPLMDLDPLWKLKQK